MNKSWRRVLYDSGGAGGEGAGGGGGGDTGGGAGAAGAGGASGSTPDPNAGKTATPAPPADWKAGLDPELAKSPILTAFKDVAALAKSHIDAQKLLGHRRTALPEKNWSEAQYNEFYNQLGRPEAPDKYNVPKVQLSQGIELPEENINAAKAEFHKLGLSGQQFEGVLKWYLDYVDKGYKSAQEAVKTKASQAEAKLKEEWGDEYVAKQDMAKEALRQYASEEFLEYIDQTGLGNHPELIKAFAKIGHDMVEDSARGRGPGMHTGGAAAAAIAIDELKMNREFMDAFLTRHHPGHDAAVAKWRMLHERVHGKEIVQPA